MKFSTTKNQQFKKQNLKECPRCSKQGKKVGEVTIMAQLKKEMREAMLSKPDGLNFCTNPDCRVVYYSSSCDELFFEEDVKSKVTCKNDDPSTPLCYCHKYRKADAIKDMEKMQGKELVRHIKKIISQDKSFCKKSNPRGSCCTSDIKEWLAKRGIKWDEEKRIALTPFKSVVARA